MAIIISLILVYPSAARYWKFLQLTVDNITPRSTPHLILNMCSCVACANHTFQSQKIKDRPNIDNWFKHSQ